MVSAQATVRPFTLIVAVSIYTGVEMVTSKYNVVATFLAPGDSTNTLCHQNQDKLWLDRPLG